jgi:hypothetical protein
MAHLDRAPNQDHRPVRGRHDDATTQVQQKLTHAVDGGRLAVAVTDEALTVEGNNKAPIVSDYPEYQAVGPR